MRSTVSKILKIVIGVSPKEALSFSAGNTVAWRQLEKSVLAAIDGYHATLEDHRLATLIPRLNTIESELRGFAYEGAAMGLTGLDCVLPGSKSLKAFLEGAGSAHQYMVHIGIGEALARLRRQPERVLSQFDPVLRWLVVDGYGFHEGFFAPRRSIEAQARPAHLSPYARRIFDQGLGRAIWFLHGADVDRVRTRIHAFPPARHADLWSGIGVACAYAGGITDTALERLRREAHPYTAHVAMGAAVVAKGRQRAGNPAAHSDLACTILCGVSSDQAAAITDGAFQNLPVNGKTPAYAILQQRLISHFALPSAIYDQEEMMQ